MQAGAEGGFRPGRRTLTALAAAVVFRPAWAEAGLNLPPGDAIAFRILRDGTEVGSHRIDFERRGKITLARIAIDIAVRYGWVTVYRLAGRATEIWQGERFLGIDSHTDDNGTAAWMRTAPDPGGGFQVSGSGTAPYVAPPGALASTYWNPAILAAPVINSQDGRLSEPEVLTGPLEEVPSAAGPVQARRHDMHGDPDMEIWYDLDRQWAYLRFRRGGSVITYLRT